MKTGFWHSKIHKRVAFPFSVQFFAIVECMSLKERLISELEKRPDVVMMVSAYGVGNGKSGPSISVWWGLSESCRRHSGFTERSCESALFWIDRNEFMFYRVLMDTFSSWLQMKKLLSKLCSKNWVSKIWSFTNASKQPETRASGFEISKSKHPCMLYSIWHCYHSSPPSIVQSRKW